MSSVCIQLGFSHVCAAQTTYFILHQIIKIEPDFPCLADEIAEPRPDMNVAAFTIREKSFNNMTMISLIRLSMDH